MKTTLLLALATGAILFLSACTTVETQPAVHSTTTTTEETRIQRPSTATTESHTVRTY